jgi:hypothetical protein
MAPRRNSSVSAGHAAMAAAASAWALNAGQAAALTTSGVMLLRPAP